MQLFVNNLAYIIMFFLSISCTSMAATLTEVSQEVSDSVITAKIIAQFAQDNYLNPLKISVSTTQGSVTLSGYVPNKNAFIRALRMVKNTSGVTTIDTDRLYIKQVNTAVTDALITAQVEAAVLKAKVLDDETIPLVGINARTINGTVTLLGELPTAQALSFVIKRIEAIKGVKKIITHLTIKDKG